MITCKDCGTSNREGVMFCDNCGFPLDERVREQTLTRRFDKANLFLSAKATWGTARLTQKSQVLLHVVDGKEPISLSVDKRSTIGREDVSTNTYPDVNLVPFGALEKGVSRIHASIERSEDTLTIIDMGSSNGTYLNGQRLVAQQPRVLRDGDEIRFGKLVTRIYFK